MDEGATWTEVDLGPGHIVLDGTKLPLLKKWPEPLPQFSAHAYCGQTAGWIKMALGVEMGFGADHFMLDGDPAPLPKDGPEPSIFSPFLL